MDRVFEFLHTTNDALIDRGVELPLSGQATTTPDPRAEARLAAQRQIIGAEAVERMYTSAADDDAQPAMRLRISAGPSATIRSPAARHTS